MTTGLGIFHPHQEPVMRPAKIRYTLCSQSHLRVCLLRNVLGKNKIELAEVLEIYNRKTTAGFAGQTVTPYPVSPTPDEIKKH